MSRTEIKKFQQEGRLDEALAMAMEQYVLNPDALWAKTDLAWTYDAMCKKAAAEGDLSAFEQAYRPIVNLGLLSTDQMLKNTLCWRFRSLLASCSAKMEASAIPAFAQQVWEIAYSLGEMQPSEASSVLCKAFYHLRDNWPGFIDFMDWWGWQNFRSEDYRPEKLPNGKQMPMSLAEGCHVAYAKLLLQLGDRERISAFLPRLETLGETYPDMLYPGYYTGKLLIATGGDKTAMLQSVLPFVRRKSGEFWAWQLLAEVEQDDETLFLACLLRAVNCKTQDTFLVKILYLLTTLCLSRRDYVAARIFLQRYVAAKTAAQNRMPAEVYHWINEPWFIDVRYDTSVSTILQIDYLDVTDGLIYADIPEQPAYVVRYVPETRIATLIYGYQERGFIKLPKSMKGVSSGTFLMVRLQQPIQTGGKLLSYTIRKSRWEDLPSSRFIREIEGKITSNKSKTVFFVQFGKEFAFVPNELYKKRLLVVGERMIARILWDYQKNKECWSWRCFSIKGKAK